MRILLVEDQRKLAGNIQQYLESETYAVDAVHDGTEGFERAMSQAYDLIILDINLPGMEGYDVCTRLRDAGKKMPILMLTARTKREEVVHGLNIGADDYLTKPFDLEELLARVRSLLRRGTGQRQPVLKSKDISLDTNAQHVTRKGKTVELAPKEYALLEYLMRHAGVAQDRASIMEHVWGGGDELLFSQTIDVHVAYLRRKLGKDAIQTVPGKGYLVPG